MLPKQNIYLVNLQKSLPTEFRSWLWFDKHVVRNERISVLMKESSEWQSLLITEEILPAYVKSNRQKRARFLSQILKFWEECFDPSNPWQLSIEKGNVKVMVRKKSTWLSFRKSLLRYSRGFIVSFENYTKLRELGLNSSFDSFTAKKVIPFGICGYINHKCGHSCHFSVVTKDNHLGKIVPVILNWYLDDSNISCDEDKVLDEKYDQNKSGLPVVKGDEFVINYGRKLWFQCHCGESSCVHGDQKEVVEQISKKRKTR